MAGRMQRIKREKQQANYEHNQISALQSCVADCALGTQCKMTEAMEQLRGLGCNNVAVLESSSSGRACHYKYVVGRSDVR